MPKGLLLAGRPGTGKTFLAACIASEANLPFIYIDASSLRGMFWGMDALMVIKLFRDARGLGRRYAEKGKRGACIVFMDEIDSIGMTRGGQGGGRRDGRRDDDGRRSAGLNTLLNQMDSLGDTSRTAVRTRSCAGSASSAGRSRNKPLVFVIGATNRPEVLDPALTRPGRLDRILEVFAPTPRVAATSSSTTWPKKQHDPDIDIEFMVADSIGWTPIDDQDDAQRGPRPGARRRPRPAHLQGLARRRRRPDARPQAADPRDARGRPPAIAYHEAGHAVAAHYLQPENRLLKATIIRRGGALGVVQPQPSEERHTRHARQIETDIMVSSGRARSRKRSSARR